MGQLGRLAAKFLGPGRLHVDVRSPEQFVADTQHPWHVVLLVADEAQAGLRPANVRTLVDRCRAAWTSSTRRGNSCARLINSG